MIPEKLEKSPTYCDTLVSREGMHNLTCSSPELADETLKRYNAYADQLKQKADLVLESNILKDKIADQQAEIEQLARVLAVAKEEK